MVSDSLEGVSQWLCLTEWDNSNVCIDWLKFRFHLEREFNAAIDPLDVSQLSPILKIEFSEIDCSIHHGTWNERLLSY